MFHLKQTINNTQGFDFAKRQLILFFSCKLFAESTIVHYFLLSSFICC